MILVCGSRTWRNYSKLESVLDNIRTRQSAETTVELLSGGAAGADTMAERYAAEHSLPMNVDRPRWEAFGKRAGLMRNKQMVDKNPDLVVAFYASKERSSGTAHTVRLARAKKITVLEVFDREATEDATAEHE